MFLGDVEEFLYIYPIRKFNTVLKQFFHFNQVNLFPLYSSIHPKLLQSAGFFCFVHGTRANNPIGRFLPLRLCHLNLLVPMLMVDNTSSSDNPSATSLIPNAPS